MAKSKIEKMSKEKIFEGITDEQKIFLDIVRAGRKDPVLFAYEILGVQLHDSQKLWLWMTSKTQTEKAYGVGLTLGKWKSRGEFNAIIEGKEFLQNILVPSNRWGKTMITSVKHIWYNFYKIGARGDQKEKASLRCGTLNLSPHSNQCQAGYDYILDILNSSFVFNIGGQSLRNKCLIGDFITSSNIQKRQIFFKNGTFYRAVPTGEDQASSLAGTPYLYISYDECAQSLHLKEEIPAKIMSRLIDFGGPLDLVSTPEVDRPSHQYFYHIAKLGLKAEKGWWTLIGKITDNVFLGTKEVQKIITGIKSIDPIKYRQVAYGEFVTTGKKMFDTILIERLWDEFDKTAFFPIMDHKYLLSADWGFADTGDPTVFYIIDYTDAPRYRIAFRESIRGGSPFAILARTKILQREWNGAKFIHDSSSMGGVIIKKMLTEMNIQVIDFVSAGGQKQDMLFCLIMAMSENRKAEISPEGLVIEKNPNFGRLRSFYIPTLEEQMGNYQYNPDKGVSDKRLEQDDVMSLGQAIWYLERKHMKNKATAISFNPFADTAEQIIPQKDNVGINLKTINIPEKRIF